MKKLAQDFFAKFNNTHVILYVGKNTSDCDLKKISECKWSCVITSRTDEEFFSYFNNDNRTSSQCTSLKDLPSHQLDRKKLPIVYLYGINGMVGDDEIPDFLHDKADDAKELFKASLAFAHPANPIVMVGIDSDDDLEILGDRNVALHIFNNISEGTISVWGVTQQILKEKSSFFSQLCVQKRFETNEVSLVNVIDEHLNSEGTTEEFEYLPADQGDDFYYQSNMPMFIKSGQFLGIENIGTLLTEKTINKIKPLGKAMLRQWFSTFLEFSSSSPQWYAYSDRAPFYIKRGFEDPLMTIVERALEGHHINGFGSVETPIILSGDPGSSKSVTLAAIAYKVFCKKINPVIYISNEYFLGNNISMGIDALDSAIRSLEINAQKSTRILVVWDCAAYHVGIENAINLYNTLKNRGRRLVLVCSSYNFNTFKKDESYYLDVQDNLVKGFPEDKTEIRIINDCLSVQSTRLMSGKEKNDFWSLIKQYSGLPDVSILGLKSKFNDNEESDIFIYFYKLISLLRSHFIEKLQREQNKITPYITKELGLTFDNIKERKKKEKKESPVFQALLAAGAVDEDFEFEDDNAEENDAAEALCAKFEKFNACVALFSRFKLAFPYGLAYSILFDSESSKGFSIGNQEIFKIITTDIPWLKFQETSTGDFAFSFRNSLEAEIYLAKHDYNDGKKQIQLLCEMIDIYGNEYKRSKMTDSNLTYSIQTLIRLMGPNSTYFSQKNSTVLIDKNDILNNLPQLIEKIDFLIDDCKVIDDDASFATIYVTFTREYYGRILTMQNDTSDNDVIRTPDFYEERIEKLFDAMNLAKENLDNIDQLIPGIEKSQKNHYFSQRNSLVVEMAQCNCQIIKLVKEFKKSCDYYNYKQSEKFDDKILNYRWIYNHLWRVISSDPTNGFSYNSLFQTFELMYQEEQSKLTEEEKLQHLMEITRIIDDCRLIDANIVNRGSNGDELSGHITKISSFVDSYNVTIDAINEYKKNRSDYSAPQDNTGRFLSTYQKMLESQNTTAIIFVCQKELPDRKKAHQPFNPDDLAKIKKVYDFMTEKDHLEIIIKDIHALALLIDVCWMLYNRRFLNASEECQLTKINAKEWNELYTYCQQYYLLCKTDNNKLIRPVIISLYALATLHKRGFDGPAFEEVVSTILPSLNEEVFFNQPRMRALFMLCDENGNTLKFKGTVTYAKDNAGRIKVVGIPERLGNERGIRFKSYNLGRSNKMPEVNDNLTDLEIGLGYTCFSAHKEEGRKERSIRR